MEMVMACLCGEIPCLDRQRFHIVGPCATLAAWIFLHINLIHLRGAANAIGVNCEEHLLTCPLSLFEGSQVNFAVGLA